MYNYIQNNVINNKYYRHTNVIKIINITDTIM